MVFQNNDNNPDRIEPAGFRQKVSSHLVITLGFVILGLLFVILFGVAMWSISFNERRIQALVDEYHTTDYVVGMRDAAQRRAMILHRVALMKDTFEIDNQLMEFRHLASDFIGFRDAFLQSGLNDEQRRLWSEVFPKIRKNYKNTNETATLLYEGNVTKANQKFVKDVLGYQDEVLDGLTSLFDANRIKLQQGIDDTFRFNTSAFVSLGLLGSILLVFGFSTAYLVIAKTRRIDAELLSARNAAEAASRTKSQFLANMSHEIRTPISAIIGFSETALESQSTRTEKDEALSTVVKNGRHLLHVINEILDISKVEANKLEVDIIDCSLVEIMVDVESLIGMQAREKGLSFSLDYMFPIPGRINTDPIRLKQILLNLCSNAIKFTNTGSVEVRVEFLRTGNQLRISVKDTGIGLTEDQKGHLFQMFQQAESSTSRRYGGTGLGLYISRQLALRLGGDITVESISGLGSRFDLVIELGAVDEKVLLHEYCDTSVTEPDQSDVAEIPRVQGKVLLAEDSSDNQRLISLYLQKLGATVEIANNGEEAVDKALAGDYDLVLMDMQMPIMNGPQATRRLRRASYAKPIVALTANAMKEDREKCLDAGCDDFLSKPIDRNLFNQKVAQYLTPSAPVIDSAQQTGDVLHSDDDEQAEMRELVMRFLHRLTHTMQEIKQALQEQNWQQLRSVCHQLKGLGGSFGYPEITELAADLERAVISGSYAQLDEKVQKLDTACQNACCDI